MRVLVAISILAFLALLWASIAIFRHIRRAQRRRRRALEAIRNNLLPIVPVAVIAPPPPAVPEITFNDPEAPLPEVTFTDSKAPIREPMPRVVQRYARHTEARAGELSQTVTPPAVHVEYASPMEVTAAAAEEFIDTQPPPSPSPATPLDPALSPLPYWPNFGFTPSSTSSTFAPALEGEDDLYGRTQIPPQPQPEPIPYAGTSDSSTAINPARLPIVIHPPAPAIKPVYPSHYPAQQEPDQQQADPPPPPITTRATHQPTQRADWAYFNKDMGDLTDPPPAGSRTRVPVYVPQTPNKTKGD